MLEDDKTQAAKLAKERYENRDKYTPMMRQYIETKSKYLDCILCYRLGDFYEMFFEDAVITSREIELTLTGKDCGQDERAPMCGIPHHAINSYIPKLVEKGYKVAICEQLDDPKNTKGIVRRDVVKVITPGTIVDGNILEEKKNNYIMSIYKEGMFFGVAVCDISTGDFYATEIKEDNNFAKLLDEISRYNPSELVINKMMSESIIELNKIKQRFSAFITIEDNIDLSKSNENITAENESVSMDSYSISTENKEYWENEGELTFSSDSKNIKSKFDIVDKNDKAVNIEKKMFATCAINGLMNYVQTTQKQFPQNLNKIVFYEPTKYMSLDISARRNLEITEKMRDKAKKGTLLWVLDKTSTSMGGRLIRRWLNDPLTDIKDINLRLRAVKELKDNRIIRDEIIGALKKVYDIERLAGKISYGTANARDMISLKNSIAQLPNLKKSLSMTESKLLKNMHDSLDTLDDLFELINKAIVDDPPITLKDGGVIKKGYNEELDRLIEITTNGKQWLVNIEAEEREKTGIKNLKIGYNKVFGYYIEISKSFVKLAPKDRYIRKQTLTNRRKIYN